MIFLDTNIISYYFNGSIEIKEKLLEAIDNDENIATTIINVYEILKGLRWKNNNNKEKLFKDFVENVLVFTIDNNVIELAANIYADLRKQGKIIGDADILIAAIVMNNKGKLVSNNIKHYENIKNLNLVNWFD
ncbi:MAG: PIN domain-containing protein [Bacteroidetes bacterium]|nr:PIN domain-containing protein [Bacteroidota bacterium]